MFLGDEYIFHGEKQSFTIEKQTFHTVKHYYRLMALFYLSKQNYYFCETSSKKNPNNEKNNYLIYNDTLLYDSLYRESKKE